MQRHGCNGGRGWYRAGVEHRIGEAVWYHAVEGHEYKPSLSYTLEGCQSGVVVMSLTDWLGRNQRHRPVRKFL